MSGGDGTQALESIFGEISRILVQRLARWRAPDHAPFATEVVCIDESTLDQIARSWLTCGPCRRETRA